MNYALIISNAALSNAESNGRILSLLFDGCDESSLYNYCLGGISDKKDVHYIKMGDIRNIKSLLSFGYVKPSIDCYVDSSVTPSVGNGATHKNDIIVPKTPKLKI